MDHVEAQFHEVRDVLYTTLRHLLRRIRETNEGGDVPTEFPLSPDMLSVVYVQSSKDGLILTSLPVTDDGDFYDRWPEGFFAERDEELF